MEKHVKDNALVPNLNANEKYTRGKRLDTMWVILILTLLIGAGILAAYLTTNRDAFDDYRTYMIMDQFNSIDEMNDYLKDRTACGYYLNEDEIYSFNTPRLTAEPTGGNIASQKGTDYSRTNIQVEGVDEADIVKTDGEYLYVVSDKNVTILKAYPAGSAAILSRIEFVNRPIELFLNEDRLMVFEDVYPQDRMYFCAYNPQTSMKIFDVSSPSSPKLVRNISVDGSYFNSRMIEDHVYVVIVHYINYIENGAELPVILDNDSSIAIEATDVKYFKPESESYAMTMMLSVNLMNEEAPGYQIYLTDSAQLMYASLENTYLTNQDYESYSGTGWTRWVQKTWIHKIAIDAGEMEYQGSMRVPGWVLNQFSMDEYEGYFRVAVTDGSTWDGSSDNRVYVLDDGLNLVGKLEGLAHGERIYSARFIGDRCYLVTYRQVDPFFVIDLSDPKNPKVLGELKIPGYSEYLHPYDENHVIGLGKESNYLKLSFFDVTDVSNPREISKFTVSGGDVYSYSDSSALYDHKAFLFSKSKNLLIVPVSLYEYGYRKYSYWQGAYVFSLTLEDGFALKGKVTHLDESLDDDDYRYVYCHDVRRSLYIEDNIYTVSEKIVKINNMDSMTELKEIEL